MLRTALKSRKCIVIEHQSFPGIRIGLEYDTYCESTSCMTQDTLQKYKLKSKYKVLCEVSKSFIGIIKVSNSQNIGITHDKNNMQETWLSSHVTLATVRTF